MKNYWLNKKLNIAVIERNGNEIRFILSNSHVWKFWMSQKDLFKVLEGCRLYPLLVLDSGTKKREYELCGEKAWDIFNGKIISSQ